MNKFNIGDIVKLKDDYVGDSVWKNKCKGDIGIITEIQSGYSIHWKNNGQVAWFYYEELELVKEFTWEDENIQKQSDESAKKFTDALKIILDLLWFEDNLDPYMYQCNDAQNGELFKPFTNAKNFLKEYECKKCKGSGIVRVGYQGWCKNPCPSCKGRGYIFKE